MFIKQYLDPRLERVEKSLIV